MNEIKNAKIDGTMLGMEDHGIFTCVLYLDYGNGAHQGFGQYSLGGKKPNDATSVPWNYGVDFIRAILETVGVEKWEDLESKYVRVKTGDEPRGFGSNIIAIGNVIEDKWFDPKEFFKKGKESHG